MGTTEDQANQKKTTVVEEESTSVGSSTALVDATDSEAESVKQPDEADDSQSASADKPQNVETLYLDDSKVGVRFDNYPLSAEVLKALADGGHQYLSRYQQVVFDILTIGVDRWFSVNLASNRGLIIGTYLVDLAQTDLTKTTSILCVAVPKIRGYFERDLLSIAKYTGVKILSVGEELSADIQLQDKPNIVLASIEMVSRLKEHLDLSEVEVVYFDEVEKTIRDAEDVFVDFVNTHAFPQVVLQSSYYSDALIESVHRCKPALDPTRLYKQHNNGPIFYTTELETDAVNWRAVMKILLPKVLLSRVVVLINDGAEMSQWLQTQGWDAIDTTADESIAPSVVDDLRENRVQLVLTTKQLFLTTNPLDFDVLVSIDKLTAGDDKDDEIVKKNRRASAIVLCGYAEETFNDVEVQSLSMLNGEFNHSQSVIHSLRQETLQGMTTDWTSLVDDILQEVDGRQLLGEALRLALQSKRAQKGYIRSSVYKLENKDVFQRRNRKRTR